uniref:Uncharacterized protein n=1 Tax=Oryza brachyantha TaxID=4533 RepID=J3M1H0_ORYBR
MLWAKKVEHFSGHQTERPCWEQCLRHLQRDRRTEPAVNLTVWSRFRVTDSNDRASWCIIILLCDLWRSKAYLRTSLKSFLKRPPQIIKSPQVDSGQHKRYPSYPSSTEEERKR